MQVLIIYDVSTTFCIVSVA